MKMFRRISALALAVVMICLLSASVFAAALDDYDYRDSHSFGDEYNTEVIVLANVNQHSTAGYVEMLTQEAFGNEISISLSYQYYPDSAQTAAETRTRTDGVIEANVWSSSIVKEIASTFQMKEAEYSFSVACVTSYGTDYCDFDSDVITYP